MRRAALALLLCLLPATGFAAPRLLVVDEGERVLRRGGDPVADVSAQPLSVMRGETAAFQLVVLADAPLEALTVEATARPPLHAEVFIEHYVRVAKRSRNERHPGEALPFRLAATPEDAGMLGELPDALFPTQQAGRWLYPSRVQAGDTQAFYIEVYVPPDTAPHTQALSVKVLDQSVEVGTVAVDLVVLPTELSYGLTSSFAYYERRTLERVFPQPDLVEKRLAQLLHAHGLDPVTQIVSEADVDRVRGMLDGSWFTPAAGYHGPGEGRGVEVVPLGAYGTLGDPSDASLARVRKLADRIGPGVADVFVYAIDEQCDSPRGPGYRALLSASTLSREVGVAHTCHRDPNGQDVDLVMMPAQTFDPDQAARARTTGKRVFVYNGQLPFAGPLMLDVPLTSLTHNGWLGATFDVDRWFYWETIFWRDSNRGGKGPRDVFASAETFHNADGDVALLDGLLVYPGRLPGPHDTAKDDVFPSLRLKSLRRGKQDAALIALAAMVDAETTESIVRGIVPRAFDEAHPNQPARFAASASALRRARAELRELAMQAPNHATEGQLRAALREVRDFRSRMRREQRLGGEATGLFRFGVFVLLPLCLWGWGLLVAFLASARESD